LKALLIVARPHQTLEVQGASCKAHVQCTDCLLYPSIIIYIASYRVTNCKALLAVYQCHTYKVHTSAIQERKQIFFLLSTTLSLQTHISNPIQSNPINQYGAHHIGSACYPVMPHIIRVGIYIYNHH
jgi:hypothetical protein